MKITVLLGSPKGEKSVTLRYVNHLVETNPEVNFNLIHVSSRIRQLEKDSGEVISAVRDSDAVAWAFPVYTYLVPAAYKRFIEIIRENGAVDAFAGKYAFSISTSIHFFDHTAHAYIRAVSEDMGMKFAGSYSAVMHDLLEENGRKNFGNFFSRVLRDIESGADYSRNYSPVEYNTLSYSPVREVKRYATSGKKVLIVTESGNRNLDAMVERAVESIDGEVTFRDITRMKILGGCLGCMKCSLDNVCVYGDKDDIKRMYEKDIPEADILIFAGTIVDRFFSSKWKQFMERRFMHNHQPFMVNKQVAYLVSGPLSQNATLREILEADVQVNGGNLAGIVTDECDSPETLDSRIDTLISGLMEMTATDYLPGFDCRGIGGRKIFRDSVWGPLRFVFQADHRYYKSHGYYDFPQKNIKMRVKNFIMMTMFRIPKVRQNVRNRMSDMMLKPFWEKEPTDM